MIQQRLREKLKTETRFTAPSGAQSATTLAALLDGVIAGLSLREAANRTGVSYRHAWGVVTTVGKELGTPLITSRVGGVDGGGSTVTEAGHMVAQELHRVAVECAAVVQEGSPSPEEQEVVLVAATTESVETGVIDAIAARLLAETGIRLGYLPAGSGSALALARSGRIDLTLTHAPELERQYIAEGWGDQAVPIMSSQFVIIGPADDPAGVLRVQDEGNPARAFARIADARAPFMTRGDQSGTHVRERRLWLEAGCEPGAPWYQVAGGGNREVILRAAEAGAYTLVDEATVRRNGLPPELVVVYRDGDLRSGSGDNPLHDLFSLIPVRSSLVGRRNHTRCTAAVTWITAHAAGLLESHVDAQGAPLFQPFL